MFYHIAYTLQSQYSGAQLITLSSALIVLSKFRQFFFFPLFLLSVFVSGAGSHCKHKWLIQIQVQAELVLSDVAHSGLRRKKITEVSTAADGCN